MGRNKRIGFGKDKRYKEDIKGFSDYPESNTNPIDLYDVPDRIIFWGSEEHINILKHVANE